MKRDLSLVRHILSYLEQQPAGTVTQQISVPQGTDNATLGEHVELMIKRGLLEGDVRDVGVPIFVVERLTWEGHDFLQAIQSDTVWKRILGKATELGGGMTLEIAKALGRKYHTELAGV